MILSFGDSATEALYHGRKSKGVHKFPADIRATALRKLDLLNAAHDLRDLRFPPGNRLEALRGDFAGFHSIRANDQWRIVFRWDAPNAYEVRVTDYH